METPEQKHERYKKLGQITRDKFFNEFPKKFWSQVNKMAPNGCHEWTGELNNKGYGVARRCKQKEYCHRWVLIFANGSIPKGMVVMHKCDNPKCVNIEHLQLGTKKQNSEDMVKKGRCKHGESHYNAKLTSEKVVEIRNALDRGDRLVYMATKYGVSERTIREVRDRLIWKHVP